MPASRLAIDLAKRAVELDVARAFADAALAYDDAATQLERESSSASDADALLAKAREYRKRAEEIRRTRVTNGDASTSMSSRDRGKKKDEESSSGVVAGAAAVGAAAGFALLGPMSAVVAAGAMAYGTQRKDGWGKACKGVGKAAACSYTSLKRFNDEYKITDKASRAARTTAKGAKRLNDEYKITERTSTAISASAKAASEFNEKHGVTKTIGQGVTAGFDAVSKTFSSQNAGGSATEDALPSAPAR